MNILSNPDSKPIPGISDKDHYASMTTIQNFKMIGISILQLLSETELVNMIHICNHAYYNASSLITDNEYDIIKEYIATYYPNNKINTEIGAPVETNKVVLPFEMPSMDKIKPDTNALSAWVSKYNSKQSYVLSSKLDGVSGLYTVENNICKLYTRGNGTVGQDISHLIPLLQLPISNGFSVRGEFIIPKEVFSRKYKNIFANPRNMVAGTINRKTNTDNMRDIHFVAYEIIHPPILPSVQMSLLTQLGFKVVWNSHVDLISNSILSNLLMDKRTESEYEIDGIIVRHDKIYPRASGNPEYAFAFKMVLSDQIAEAKVVDVIWSPSKAGYLKPRVRIEPIHLCGVTIEYATGFNAKFIETNKIGIGALIQIIRSGDVIPYIKSVTVPAEVAKMPTVPYIWTDTHVDILIENIDEDATVCEKMATTFFVYLKVDGLSIGNIMRVFKGGFNSVPKILRMSKSDFESIDGFKSKMADKIHSSIKEKIKAASLIDIMVASGKLGRGLGEKKIKVIMEAFPDILVHKNSNEYKINQLTTINGIGKENATDFVNNIPIFLDFIKQCDLEYKMQINDTVITNIIQNIDTQHPLYKKKIVMTKVRNKSIIDALPTFHATLEDTISKNTFVLIVKSMEDKSNKTEFAIKNNIPIMTPDDFIRQYL